MPQGRVQENDGERTRVTLEGKITGIPEVRFDHALGLQRTTVLFTYRVDRQDRQSMFDFFRWLHEDVIGERFKLREYYLNGHNHPHQQELLIRTVRTYRSEMTTSTASTPVLFKDP